MDPTSEGVLSEAVVYCTALYLAAQNGHRNVVKYISELKIKPDKEEAFRSTALYLAAYNGIPELAELFSLHIKQNTESNYATGLNIFKGNLELLERKTIETAGKYDKVINKLLKTGVNSIDENGNTALHYAAMDGNINLLERLLKLNASVEIKNKNYESVLHLAVGSGNVDVVRLLLENIFVDVRNLMNNTPLYYAVEKADINVIELLCDQGAQIDVVNTNQDTLFHYVNNEEVLNFFVNKGGKIALIKPNGNNLLHNAVEKNFDVMIDIYIQRGIQINSLNSNNETPLHLAAKLGYKNIVVKLLKHNADIVCKTKSGALAIHYASMSGHEGIVDLFLERGIDVNLALTDNSTCLVLAAQNGHVNVVKILLAKGANVNIVNGLNYPPLYYAIINKNLEIIEMCSNKNNINKLWHNNHTALSLAAEKGDVDLVKLLLRKGADVNIVYCSNYPPLYYAIINKNLEIIELCSNKNNINNIWSNNRTALCLAAEKRDVDSVKLLLRKGADVNIVNGLNYPPLYFAIINKNLEIIELCSNKNNINKLWHNNCTALSLAAEKGDVDSVKLLLRKGADVNIVNELNYPPLYYAIINKNLEIIELCSNKNNVNKLWRKNRTALSFAAEKGNVEIVKILLAKGADVNIADSNKSLPIYFALRNGLTEIAELCLDKINDINHINNYSETVLSLAIDKRYLAIVKQLLDKGADINPTKIKILMKNALSCDYVEIINMCLGKLKNVNETDSNRRTTLSFAAENGHVDIVKQLLAKGADVNIVTKDNYNSPIHYAFQKGHLDIVELCLDSKIDVNLINKNYETYLSLAAANNCEVLVKKLLAKGASTTITSYDYSPLYKAAYHANLNIVRLLLKHEKDNNIPSYNKEQIEWIIIRTANPNIKLLLSKIK